MDGLRTTLSFFVDPIKYLVDLPSVLLDQIIDSATTYRKLKSENEKSVSLIESLRISLIQAKDDILIPFYDPKTYNSEMKLNNS